MLKRLFSCLLVGSFATTCASSIQQNGDYIVVLHGAIRTSASMKPFAKYFEKRGYNVININYPSPKHTIEEISEIVFKEIEDKTPDKTKKVHFIGYSMGSLITRYILSTKKIDNLGRVVFIAPPSQGSEIADFLRENVLYKKVYGLSGQQLGTDEYGFAGKLPPVNDYEVGIIAGNIAINPLFLKVLPTPNDGTVAVERTKIEGMKDHIVIRATHTFIINNKTAMKQAENFILNGSFIREAADK